MRLNQLLSVVSRATSSYYTQLGHRGESLTTTVLRYADLFRKYREHEAEMTDAELEKVMDEMDSIWYNATESEISIMQEIVRNISSSVGKVEVSNAVSFTFSISLPNDLSTDNRRILSTGQTRSIGNVTDSSTKRVLKYA